MLYLPDRPKLRVPHRARELPPRKFHPIRVFESDCQHRMVQCGEPTNPVQNLIQKSLDNKGVFQAENLGDRKSR